MKSIRFEGLIVSNQGKATPILHVLDCPALFAGLGQCKLSNSVGLCIGQDSP